MASSSSCASSIQTRSDPIEGDVLWMQPKHVSEHVWNGEADRKLHIRRAVPTYQGEEQIPEEIVPLLRQSGFYWIIKMGFPFLLHAGFQEKNVFLTNGMR